MADQHKVEDVIDLLRTKIDLELRQHRRRLRRAGEKEIDRLIEGDNDFDVEALAEAALAGAAARVYGIDPASELPAIEA